jgi:hypothetical protein
MPRSGQNLQLIEISEFWEYRLRLLHLDEFHFGIEIKEGEITGPKSTMTFQFSH